MDGLGMDGPGGPGLGGLKDSGVSTRGVKLLHCTGNMVHGIPTDCSQTTPVIPLPRLDRTNLLQNLCPATVRTFTQIQKGNQV